jgi:hypothetical protein
MSSYNVPQKLDKNLHRIKVEIGDGKWYNMMTVLKGDIDERTEESLQ